MSFYIEKLAAIPRLNLLQGPTPLQRAERLEADLAREGIHVNIYLKRDDFMSLGGGGNKLRKLEYHLAAVQSDQHDTVITFGGIQSNHARLTAAACAKLGMECHLILTNQVSVEGENYRKNGNTLLNGLFGAHASLLPSGSTAQAFANELEAGLTAGGRRVSIIPTGGSTPLGALGYVQCAIELKAQAEALKVAFRRVYIANGSSGTHAGLSAGFVLEDVDPDIATSFAVMGNARDARRATMQLTQGTLNLLGSDRSILESDILIDDTQIGEGYGLPTQAMREAVRLLARTEGVLLDPVYSGKAFAGLLADLRRGLYVGGDNVVFIMTGGTPGLFAYRETF
jgi:D-cysteine desulfhydrase